MWETRSFEVIPKGFIPRSFHWSFHIPPHSTAKSEFGSPVLPHFGQLIIHWTTLNQALTIKAWLRVDIEVIDVLKRARKAQNQSKVIISDHWKLQIWSLKTANGILVQDSDHRFCKFDHHFCKWGEPVLITVSANLITVSANGSSSGSGWRIKKYRGEHRAVSPTTRRAFYDFNILYRSMALKYILLIFSIDPESRLL